MRVRLKKSITFTKTDEWGKTYFVTIQKGSMGNVIGVYKLTNTTAYDIVWDGFVDPTFHSLFSERIVEPSGEEANKKVELFNACKSKSSYKI